MGDTIVSAVASFGGEPEELRVVVRGYELEVATPAMGDALLSVALIPAMSRGQTLEVEDPVSAELLENAQQVQSIFHLWFPRMSIVDVRAPVFAGAPPAAASGSGKRAHFFSGGIDSLHSVYAHLDSVDALVFVDGSDVRDSTPELQRETERRLTAAAARFGRPLIYVESNVGTGGWLAGDTAMTC